MSLNPEASSSSADRRNQLLHGECAPSKKRDRAAYVSRMVPGSRLIREKYDQRTVKPTACRGSQRHDSYIQLLAGWILCGGEHNRKRGIFLQGSNHSEPKDFL